MNATISEHLQPIDLHIEQIYLDPNNPRFVNDDWSYIPTDQIDLDTVQAGTRRRMEDHFNVDKLRINMEVNGYLPTDRIIVQRFKNEKYVVLEGNRRVSAAKQIYEVPFLPLGEIDKVQKSLESIPCLEYSGPESDAAWVLQGIRHITGIANWSAYSKARMLSERQDKGESLTDVGKRFGLSAYGAGAWVRGYKAYMQARNESQYGREIDERIYPFFQEIFNRSNISLRKWLDWNEKDQRFESDLNLNEFLGWFYPKEEPEDDRDVADVRGDWDKRIINTVHTLREISYLLSNSTPHFEMFLNNGDLSGVVALAKAQAAEEKIEYGREPAKKLLQTMDQLTRQLEDIPMLRFGRSGELQVDLRTKLAKLREVMDEVNDALNG